MSDATADGARSADHDDGSNFRARARAVRAQAQATLREMRSERRAGARAPACPAPPRRRQSRRQSPRPRQRSGQRSRRRSRRRSRHWVRRRSPLQQRRRGSRPWNSRDCWFPLARPIWPVMSRKPRRAPPRPSRFGRPPPPPRPSGSQRPDQRRPNRQRWTPSGPSTRGARTRWRRQRRR